MYIYKKRANVHITFFFMNVDYERGIRIPIRKDSLPPSVTESVCVVKNGSNAMVGYILQGGREITENQLLKTFIYKKVGFILVLYRIDHKKKQNFVM